MDPNQYPPANPAPDPGAPQPGAQYPPQAPYPPAAPYPPGAPLPPGAIPATPSGYPMTFAAPRRRSNRGRIISVVVGIVVVLAVVIGAGVLLGQNADAGKVVFTHTKPGNCHVSDQVTTVKTSTGELHIVGIFHSRISSGTELKLEVVKDGVSLGDAAVNHSAADCFDDQEDITNWQAGTYKFIYKTDKTEAEGTIVIQEP